MPAPLYFAAFVPFQAFRNWKRSLENPEARDAAPVGVLIVPVDMFMLALDILYLYIHLNITVTNKKQYMSSNM